MSPWLRLRALEYSSTAARLLWRFGWHAASAGRWSQCPHKFSLSGSVSPCAQIRRGGKFYSRHTVHLCTEASGFRAGSHRTPACCRAGKSAAFRYFRLCRNSRKPQCLNPFQRRGRTAFGTSSRLNSHRCPQSRCIHRAHTEYRNCAHRIVRRFLWWGLSPSADMLRHSGLWSPANYPLCRRWQQWSQFLPAFASLRNQGDAPNTLQRCIQER